MLTPLQAIAVLFIRILAAALLFQNLAKIGFALSALFGRESLDSDTLELFSWYIFEPAMSAIVSIIFWVLSFKLGQLIAPTTRIDSISLSIDYHDLLKLSTFLIGLFFFISSCPSIISHMAIWTAQNLGENTSFLKPSRRGFFFNAETLLPDFIQMVVAMWLIFRPSDIPRVFVALRYGGLYREKSQEDADE